MRYWRYWWCNFFCGELTRLNAEWTLTTLYVLIFNIAHCIHLGCTLKSQKKKSVSCPTGFKWIDHRHWYNARFNNLTHSIESEKRNPFFCFAAKRKSEATARSQWVTLHWGGKQGTAWVAKHFWKHSLQNNKLVFILLREDYKTAYFSGCEAAIYGLTLLTCNFELTIVIIVACHLVAPQTT